MTPSPAVYDPEIQQALSGAPPEFLQPLTSESIPTARSTIGVALSATDDALRMSGALSIGEHTVPGPDGDPDVHLVTLTPTLGNGPWPCLYHVHGGGMVMGDSRTGLTEMAGWAADLGMVVVSVEYRLAPEHPYPAPLEDAYAGLLAVTNDPGSYGIDADRVVIAGGSAGGGLAAGVALLARDRGGPRLTHQLLMAPMLDDRARTPSSQELVDEAVWDRTSNATGWTAYLGTAAGGNQVPAYAAPARAADLTGLPSTFLDVGQTETFRDEVLDYAARLAQAKVMVELHLWAGATHGFDTLAPQARVSRSARAARVEFLRRALGPEAPSI